MERLSRVGQQVSWYPKPPPTWPVPSALPYLHSYLATEEAGLSPPCPASLACGSQAPVLTKRLGTRKPLLTTSQATVATQCPLLTCLPLHPPLPSASLLPLRSYYSCSER